MKTEIATAKAMAATVKSVLRLLRHTLRQAILRKILIPKVPEEKNYVLELIPKPDAPVVYGKLKLWVRTKDLIPTREEFYSEKKEIIKVMIFRDVKKMGDRFIPTYWEMTNLKLLWLIG